jgi:hypothetical protein
MPLADYDNGRLMIGNEALSLVTRRDYLWLKDGGRVMVGGE